MNQRTRRGLTVVRAVVHEFRTERITSMVGSIADHAFVSLLPVVSDAVTLELRWSPDDEGR